MLHQGCGACCEPNHFIWRDMTQKPSKLSEATIKSQLDIMQHILLISLKLNQFWRVNIRSSSQNIRTHYFALALNNHQI